MRPQAVEDRPVSQFNADLTFFGFCLFDCICRVFDKLF
jgi:hypothetical protein